MFGSRETRLDTPMASSPNAQHYKSVALSYRLDDAQRKTPSTTQILSLKYPHPDGKKGMALAEIVTGSPVEAQAEGSAWLAGTRKFFREKLPGVSYAEGITAAYALDVPIADVERAIASLDNQGYFGEPRRRSRSGGALGRSQRSAVPA